MRRVIWLRTATVFWLGGGNVSLSCSLHMALFVLGRQKYTQQNRYCPSSDIEFEMVIEKPSHKSPGIDQIPAVLIKAEGRKIRS